MKKDANVNLYSKVGQRKFCEQYYYRSQYDNNNNNNNIIGLFIIFRAGFVPSHRSQSVHSISDVVGLCLCIIQEAMEIIIISW